MSIWRERFKTVWRWLNTPLFQSKSLHPSQASVKTESDENLEIWLEILDAEIKSGSNPKIIYPILGKYRNKLNIKFAETVSKWFRSEVKKNDIGSNRELARNLFNFAIDIYQFPLGSRADNLEIAIALYQAALEVYTRTAFPEDWAMTQNNLGLAYRNRIQGERSQNLEQAIALYQAALEVRTRTAFPENWARTQNNLGEAYEAQSDNPKAITAYQQALEIRTPSSFPLDCLKTGRNLGHLAEQLHQWDIAIEGYHNAILAIEQSRNWATSPRSKQELLESALPLYGQLIEACLHLNRPQQALLTVERSKSRRLIELLTQSDRLPQNATPQQQQQYRQLLRDIATLEQSLPDDLPQTSLNPDSQQRSAQLSPASSPQSNLKQLLQQREQLLQDINDPDFTALQTVTPQLPDFRQLLSPNSAIIEWYLPQDPNLGGYIFLIHLQQNQPQIQALRYSPQQRQTLDQFNHHYFADYRDRSWYEQLDTRLDELGQHLDLDRLLDHLPNRCQRLILIPHLYLHLFPLHALPIGPQDSDAPQLLLDRFPEGVSYAPSAQILAYLHQRRQRPDPRQFFAIQNPTQDLPYTDMEVSFIRPNFDPNSHILKGHQASKDQLNRPQTLEKLRQSHLIHFACHGGFDNANPLNSALLLAGNAPLNLEGRRTLTLRDGRRFDLDSQGLTLREIYRTLDLPACRLVILSACETGLLSSQLTDECIGLATGFLAVGSLSVLSTLWCVDDFATAWLTIRFYDEFRQDGDVVKAVYRAQQWLRQVSVADFLIWCRDSLKMSATDLDELEFQLEDYNQTAPFESRRHWSSLLVSGL